MQNIRVIEIPKMKVVTSGGMRTGEEFGAFCNWWSNIRTEGYITPRDFMWFNEKEGFVEWIFAIPNNCSDFGKYNLIDFSGGLYAVASTIDADDDNGEDKNNTIKMVYEWVNDSGCFEVSSSLNDAKERYTMFHIISPKIFREKKGYSIADVFIPIVVK